MELHLATVNASSGCVTSGTTVSAYPLNEGFYCPENKKGICCSGRCVIETLITSTTVAPYNSLHKIKELNINVTVGDFFEGYASTHVSVCLEKEKIIVFDRSNCLQYAKTKRSSDAHKYRHISWNQKLNFTGPFAKDSSLLFNLWNESSGHNRFFAHYWISMEELYYVYLPNYRKHTDDQFFVYRFSFINDPHYIGDVEMIVQFVLYS